MLEVSVSLLTAGVAVTLVPGIRRSTPWIIEVALWTALLAGVVLMIAETANPRAAELTVSAAWGAGQLIHMEASLLLAAMKGWAVLHRFDIARFVVIGAGADALALAFVVAMRGARSRRLVRLNDWYVLPRTPIPDGVVDPLAGLNRILAGATRTGLLTAGRALATSAVAEWIAIFAAHRLHPGHLRLTLVKIGLGMEFPRPLRKAQASASREPALTVLERSRPGGPGPRQDRVPRRHAPRPGGLSPRTSAAATSNASRTRKEAKNGAAHRRPNRLAS